MMMPSTTRARTPATILINVAVSMFLSFSAIAGGPTFGPPGKIDLLDQPQLMTQRDKRGSQNDDHQRRENKKNERRDHLHGRFGAHFFRPLPALKAHVVGVYP